INPFISPDANGAPYNALDTREKRDAYIQEKLNEDWDNTIPYSLNLWNCAHYLMQLFVNSHYLGEGVLMPNSAYGDYLLYNGNKSKDLELIYKNHGTLADMGSLGIPMVCVYLTDKTHGDYFGHGMNGVSTGYDITKWEDWNFIEPQTDETNIKIGDLKMPKKGEPYIPKKGETYIPKNCDEVSIEYYYVIKDKFNGKYYLDVTWLVRFKIENGIPILIGVNDDPDFIIKKQREK
ncbi:MAG: hypothetical protein NTZ83_03075, partial [Candidatus Pacearchaeota archaeon]|nr:hypothetical protein [Candidatus Pacearchaeota archaeon]